MGTVVGVKRAVDPVEIRSQLPTQTAATLKIEAVRVDLRHHPGQREIGVLADRFLRVVGIARVAAARAAPGRARPAPIYLRPADAAPASDPPPRLL